jgi:hypothetical protein
MCSSTTVGVLRALTHIAASSTVVCALQALLHMTRHEAPLSCRRVARYVALCVVAVEVLVALVVVAALYVALSDGAVRR